MKYAPHWLVAVALVSGSLLCALANPVDQLDMSGDWQGTLLDGGRLFRVVFRIGKTDGGAWTATMYSIDTSRGDPIAVNSFGQDVQFLGE